MAKIRDFRSETLEHMRENLVDKNPNWDAFTDFLWDVFSFNKTLDADLGNFDAYMSRICEINDITAAKLDEIVQDVHNAEKIYESLLHNSDQDLRCCVRLLDKLYEEIGKEDFEHSFDPLAIVSFWNRLPRNRRALDFSAMDAEEFASALATMPVHALAGVEADKLSEEQRKLYYSELYRRLAQEGLSSSQKAMLTAALGQMSHEDAMALVFGEDGQYGGDQGAPKKDPNDPLILSILAKYPDLMAIYCPNMKPDEVKAFLEMFNRVGCGYIAAANGIFVQYVSRPDEFESIFGFPMYGKDGSWNIDALAVALFCQHNHVDKGVYQYAIIPTATEMGTTSTVESHNGAPTIDIIKTAFAEGKTIVVNVQPTVMYRSDGTQYGEWGTEYYHAMFITAVDDEGNITVSSWGDQYTIKASEFSKYTIFNYEVVEHE